MKPTGKIDILDFGKDDGQVVKRGEIMPQIRSAKTKRFRNS
jgi:hypothetical protein